MEQGDRNRVTTWRAPTGTRALVAEDDVVSSTLLKYVLQPFGCEADVVHNGEEAVECAKVKSFDVAFFDLLLPGITGIEAAQRIRASAPASTLKIVAVSTLPHSEVWKDCSAAGMDGFIAKPIHRDAVARILRGMFDGNPQRPAPAPPDVLDLGALLQRLGGDTAFVRELATGFLTRCPAMLTEILDALRCSDREQLAFSAHRLSGSATEFGAHRVLKVTRELERLARADDMPSAKQLRVSLEEAVAQVQAALADVRDSGLM